MLNRCFSQFLYTLSSYTRIQGAKYEVNPKKNSTFCMVHNKFQRKKRSKIPVKKSENLDEKVQNLDPDENETDPEHCILDI